MSVTATLPLTRTATRIQSIDVLRGLVMVIMALDHTRDFLHVNGFFYNATDLNTTYPVLFLTRWITHFCAPIFVFLAGTSAFLMGRKLNQRELSLFLLTRGLWFMLLEVTLVNFIFWFDVTMSTIFLQVIWATGFSMVVLSGLIFLPKRAVLAVGLLILAGHNALDGVSFAKGTFMEMVWSMLHQTNFIPLSTGQTVVTLYPVLAWVGILALGYCFGELYGNRFRAEERRRLLRIIGLGAIGAFILIRAVNIYGDPAPWSVQKTSLFTVFSFINTTKYPPSLLYSLMTLGPGILVLSLLEGKRGAGLDFLTVFGRVPFFYYVLHFAIIHFLAVGVLLMDGIAWSEINFRNGSGGVMRDHGLTLSLVYIVWILLIAALYPLCRWYGRFKSRRSSQLWSYL
ncbi:DUF1624 domain-containing protein [Larkinella soli]|uniref:DUF1624 domain-containing protein n=1 Tax=Larkinella soli TaxID=1770527 RepID=UPI000FFB7F71|nr:heparan-alpha-glucosaminide N-acetyltransferase domain-containing protein [Larkinella soli]